MLIGPHGLQPARSDLPILTLAPMSGVGNWVFRLLCARLGARLVGVEFVNCRNIATGALHVRRALDFSDLPFYRESGQTLLAPQIYGNDPELIAAGAQHFVALGAPLVDINFGCSVPRIVAKGSGAAYLQDLDRLYRAVDLTVRAVDVPVTIKTRLGWDEASINLLEVVRRAEAAGAAAVAVHARTVRQRYGGQADWSWIARAREVATGPIIGNGDVGSPADAVRMQRQTGCDAVMVGRGAIANPWIFSGRNGASLPERIDLAAEHVTLMARFKGERAGVLETRKHLVLYFRDLHREDPLRRLLLTTTELSRLLEILRAWQREVAVSDPQAAGDLDMRLTAADSTRLSRGGSN